MKRRLTYMTYREACNTILEPTELGYTQKSKDRLWVVLCFDEWSENSLYGNAIYAQAEHSSYDLWQDELVFTDRWTAERFARQLNDTVTDPKFGDIWMAANLGDLDRFEDAYLDGRGLITRGKFRGSDRALQNRARFFGEWLANPQLHPDINEENA